MCDYWHYVLLFPMVHGQIQGIISFQEYSQRSIFSLFSIYVQKASSAFNPQLIGVLLFHLNKMLDMLILQTQFLPKSSLYGPLSQEGDPIILEDSTTRILLKNVTDPVVTGVVLAAYGHVRITQLFG